MPDVVRALEQIAEIHEQLARTEVYRGWRPVPVACSGLIGLGAAAWQSRGAPTADPWTFVLDWTLVGALALVVGCAEMIWHYTTRAGERDRRQTRHVVGQLLPAFAAGGLMTLVLMRVSPSLVSILPGLWALFFGVGIFAARPFLPRASEWVGVFYLTAGLALLATTPAADGVLIRSPWTVGGVFGAGQLVGAVVLYFSRQDRILSSHVPQA